MGTEVTGISAFVPAHEYQLSRYVRLTKLTNCKDSNTGRGNLDIDVLVRPWLEASEKAVNR